MHAKVKEGNSEQETTRGASLRELQLFLDEKDSKQSYAGLRRIGDDDGTAVWTILKKEEVAMQLEERAKEWRQEERRRDDLFNEQCAQVRAPSGILVLPVVSHAATLSRAPIAHALSLTPACPCE